MARGATGRARAAGLAAGVATFVALAVPGMASAAVTAPHFINVFPSRDFVHIEGYAPGTDVTIEVKHGPGITSLSNAGQTATASGTVGSNGIFEVNHPGGACWTGFTPDIRPGDTVTVKDANDAVLDDMVVQDVDGGRPVQTAPDTIVIHGSAANADGSRPDIALLSSRIISPTRFFANGGKRNLNAPSVTYDGPTTNNWTATYQGLTQSDIDTALSADTSAMWSITAAGGAPLESTSQETGANAIPGPTTGCAAPRERVQVTGSETTPPSNVTGLTGTAFSTSVTLDWAAATDNVAVTDYGVYRDGVEIATVQNTDASANPPTTFTDENVTPGDHTYTVNAGDAAGNRSLSMSNATTVTTTTNAAPPATHNPPVAPHSLIGFPQRDFISATGYTPGMSYRFSVIRDGNVVSTSSPVVADFTGLAEVNHPGGACWTGTTPNIQAGDGIRITDADGVSEQTTVAGVTAERPIVTSTDPNTGGGTIEVHGTAQDGAGKPLPIDQIEQRLVARNDAFDINGRRDIRAINGVGQAGTLAYDAAGSIRWTAKYTLQTPNDLARAVGGRSTSGTDFGGAESRILWLGNTPVAGTELTIYENGATIAGGPAAGIAGCSSGPAERPAPNVSLSSAPKFAATDVGGTSAVQNVTIKNTGDAPLHVDRAYLAGLNPRDYVLDASAVNGTTIPAGGSATVTVAFKPTAAGTRQANLSFADDANNSTDQTLALSAATPPPPAPASTAPVQSLAVVRNDPIQLLSPLAGGMLPVDLTWTIGGGTSELQMATGSTTSNLGAWTAVTLGNNTATSTRVNLTMGSTTGNAYQFRVRACNAGVCGGWATGPKFTLVPTDDAGMAAGQFKGTWSTVTLSGAYGGTVRRSSTSATATIVPGTSYTVSGNAAWVSTLGPDQGMAQVQVDNGKAEVVDLYSATVQPRRVVWVRNGLAPGTHTITVTALAKKSALNPGACNTGAKCAQVDIDAALMIK